MEPPSPGLIANSFKSAPLHVKGIRITKEVCVCVNDYDADKHKERLN